jgi:hypothetical protein
MSLKPANQASEHGNIALLCLQNTIFAQAALFFLNFYALFSEGCEFFAINSAFVKKELPCVKFMPHSNSIKTAYQVVQGLRETAQADGKVKK